MGMRKAVIGVLLPVNSPDGVSTDKGIAGPLAGLRFLLIHSVLGFIS